MKQELFSKLHDTLSYVKSAALSSCIDGVDGFTKGFLVVVGLLGSASLSATTVNFEDAQVVAGQASEVTVTLPAGADYLRLTTDWSPVTGSPESDALELTVVGPGEVTAFFPVFANAESGSASVTDLTGVAKLTSTGSAGDYTLSFQNKSASSTVSLQNSSLELLSLKEGLDDTGSISSESPTFIRPDEDGSPSGRITRYATYVFTPTYSGAYAIESQQLGFDGFIALYAGDQALAPFTSFIAANDDSAAGESFSRLEVSLTAGQAYTLVTTTFSTIASGSFTNRIRLFESFVPGVDKATTYGEYATQRGFVGGPDVDDTGNGILNLLEYALGRDENSPASPPLEISLVNGHLVGRFYRDPELTDITYVLQASSNLSDWDDVYNSSLDTVANADGDFQEITDSMAFTGRRFMRLQILLGDAKPVTYAAYVAAEGLVGAPEDDDNQNGLSNLAEYALGRVGDSPYQQAVEISFENGRLVGTFYRDPELTDIRYRLRVTSDLTIPFEDWDVLYDSSIDLEPNSDGDFHSVEDSELLSRQRFMSLQILFVD